MCASLGAELAGQQRALQAVERHLADERRDWTSRERELLGEMDARPPAGGATEADTERVRDVRCGRW